MVRLSSLFSSSAPESCARSGVIWLGGLFDTAHTWKCVLKEEVQKDADFKHCELKFPESPTLYVRAFADKGDIPGWFDMLQVPLDVHVDEYGCSLPQALSNVSRIHSLLDEMIASGVCHERIVLGGFSQGGTMAMLAAMQYPKRLAGAVNFTGPLLGADQLTTLLNPANSNLSILWCHGTLDKPIPQALQAHGVRALEAAGMRVEVVTEPVGHQDCPEFYANMRHFMKLQMTTRVEKCLRPETAELEEGVL